RSCCATIRNASPSATRTRTGSGTCERVRRAGVSSGAAAFSLQRLPVVAIVVVVAVLRPGDFPGDVVPVLLGPEQPPAVVAEARHLGTEDPVHAGVAIRDVDAGDLVVALVLPEATIGRVERRRHVAALGEEADGQRPGGVVDVGVEHKAGVERAAL